MADEGQENQGEEELFDNRRGRQLTRRREIVLPQTSWLQITSLIVGVLIGLGVIGTGLATFGAKLAEGDFLTIEAADAREAKLRAEFERRLTEAKSLSKEREKALVQRLEDLKTSQDAANKQMIKRIDNIYDLLINRR